MEISSLKISPSSASDFKSCPQLFKYRAVDRRAEPTSAAAARGSLVHAVLERLFAEQPAARSPARAKQLLDTLWAEVRDDPEFRPDGFGVSNEDEWLEESRMLLANYFKLEDPSALEARQLEWWVEYELTDLHLRGVIDRLEVQPDGGWVITDYKTGRVPGEAREYVASFGVRFYALLCWRAFRIMPKEIRLVYLADPAILTFTPTKQMLVAFELQMQALAKAVRRALETDDWRTRPSPYCLSCSFQSICPAWVQTTVEPGTGEGG